MIMKFESFDERQRFLDQVECSRPELRLKLLSGATLPHVVAQHLDQDEVEWVERLATGHEAFEDFEVSPLSPV